MKKQNINSQAWMAIGITVAILLIDQILKIWVKTHMTLHEMLTITSWFKICFVENNGMAYGMEFGSKLLLSLFRIIFVGFIGVFLFRQFGKNRFKKGFLICVTMLFAGALGNIIDGMFYGLIFNASSAHYVSYLVPFGEGYAPFLMGKVVDMFYFPLIVTTYPDWVPVWGGHPFVFFSPVFNFADSCISVGVVLLLLFYRKEVGKLTWDSRNKTEKA